MSNRRGNGSGTGDIMSPMMTTCCLSRQRRWNLGETTLSALCCVAVVHSGEEAVSRGAASLAEDTCASTAATADEAVLSLGGGRSQETGPTACRLAVFPGAQAG